MTENTAQAGTLASLPAISPYDYLAYTQPCLVERGGCGAEAYKPCLNISGGVGKPPLMGYAHQVRVDGALAARRAGMIAASDELADLFDREVARRAQRGTEAGEHGAETHGDSPAEVTQAANGNPAATDAAAVLAAHVRDGHPTNCVKCGFKFPRPQRRETCQSDKACERRQAARAALAGPEGT